MKGSLGRNIPVRPKTRFGKPLRSPTASPVVLLRRSRVTTIGREVVNALLDPGSAADPGGQHQRHSGRRARANPARDVVAARKPVGPGAAADLGAVGCGSTLDGPRSGAQLR